MLHKILKQAKLKSFLSLQFLKINQPRGILP